MYWYFKYPLYAVLLLAGVGLLYLAWNRVLHERVGRFLEKPAQQTVTTAATTGDVPAAGPGKSPGTAGPTAAVNAAAIAEEIERRLTSAEQQLATGSVVAARELARKVLESPTVLEFDPVWSRAVAIISKANSVLVNSDAPAPEKIAHVVKSGETLVKIAAMYGTSVGALLRFNNLKTTTPTIYAGNVFYVYKANWSIVVRKSRFALLVMDGTSLFKLYRVGTGRQNRTPAGLFLVDCKVRETTWTPPGRPPIPYGHPDNVLGTHWLGLKPTESTDVALKGYGIHGTWEPATVGTESSQGCVRMLNEDVAELFDLVPVGTRVEIKDE